MHQLKRTNRSSLGRVPCKWTRVQINSTSRHRRSYTCKAHSSTNVQGNTQDSTDKHRAHQLKIAARLNHRAWVMDASNRSVNDQSTDHAASAFPGMSVGTPLALILAKGGSKVQPCQIAAALIIHSPFGVDFRQPTNHHASC